MQDMDRIYVKEPADIKQLDEARVFKKLTEKRTTIMRFVQEISENGYLHWEKAQFKEPPQDFTKTEAWYAAREVRKLSSRTTKIMDISGEKFTWLRLNYTDKFLRYIDMYAGGQFIVDQSSEANKAERQKYLSRGILEEAIASSQLEGASTTRKYAKKMIAENKKPRNESEWMILNNYKTLQAVEENYKDRELSMEMLFEMHAMLTQNTMEESGIGRLRRDKDEIVVTYNDKVAHVPPDEEFLDREIKRLIDYVNDSEIFVHPVIKAIFIHFWIGYLHPFVDGNGRLARSLFYWYMLKNDYWAVAYLPISMIIKRAPKQYAYSYIYSEQDGLDLTYFYDYNIRKIVKAIDEFKDYTQTLQKENQEVDSKIQDVILTNERQKQLIHYLLADTTHYATITSHQNLNAISRGTARADIVRLQAEGLVEPRKEGRNIRFYASKKLDQLVNG